MQPNETETEQRKQHVLIVGAGCFGLSTAYYLLGGDDEGALDTGAPRYTVTVIDSSPIVPAPDAASSDINKVVRSTYPDGYYTGLAKDAIALWKEGRICGKENYHESGVLFLGLQTSEGSRQYDMYTNAGLKNDLDAGARVQVLPSSAEILGVIPDGVKTGPMFQNRGGYLNSDGGWAAALNAMNTLLQNVERLGGKVIPGAGMTGLQFDKSDGNRVCGVVLEGEELLDADIVILATGAWSTSILGLPESINSKLARCLTASGQTVATVRLDPEMAERYRHIPVLLDFNLGFYMFPPTDDNVVKFALHKHGQNASPLDISTSSGVGLSTDAGRGTVSMPRTTRTHGALGTRVPADVLKRLHMRLCEAYPELGALPLDSTRLCWYFDTPDEDWIIDKVAGHGSLFIATGGSGHAFKFLPVIGRLVKSRIEGKMEGSLAARFSLSRTLVSSHEPRQGPVKSLEGETLWGPDEFNEYLRGDGPII